MCGLCTQHSSLTFVTANCGNGKQRHNYANSSKFYCLIVSKSILIEAPTLGVSCPGPVSLDYVMEVDRLRLHQEILQSQTGCPIKTSVVCLQKVSGPLELQTATSVLIWEVAVHGGGLMASAV